MFTQDKNKKLVGLLLLAVVFITGGFKCGAPPAGLTAGKPKPVTINYWKVFEASPDITGLIAEYQALHPHILVNYRNFNYENFETDLLNALAENRGPDIISLHTTWMKKYKTKIEPMPASVNISYEVVQGSIKKETFTEVRSQKMPTLKDVKDLFPDVVYDNQIMDNKIYGLPLTIDTLALFYNRDLLNNAGLVYPPKTWQEFGDQVIKLTRLDDRGNILQSGAAFGTADNIARSSDLLSLIMMQNNTPMADSFGTATFNKTVGNEKVAVLPSVEALDFYTSFASPATQTYTWNNAMKNSLQAFMAGQTAFYFGYSYDIPLIRAQAPKIKFEVTTVPQGKVPANYANYWVESVLQQSQHQDEAWDFISFITTNSQANSAYLKTAQRPAALKSLIAGQLDDIRLSAFASQVLTAKSWYKGRQPQKAEEIFRSMINDNLIGVKPTFEIINLGVQKINFSI